MKLTTIGEFPSCLRPHSIGTLPKRWRSASVVTGRLQVSGDMGLAMQLQLLFPTPGALFSDLFVSLDLMVIACTRRACA
jgi:hypothetical protein